MFPEIENKHAINKKIYKYFIFEYWLPLLKIEYKNKMKE